MNFKKIGKRYEFSPKIRILMALEKYENLLRTSLSEFTKIHSYSLDRILIQLQKEGLVVIQDYKVSSGKITINTERRVILVTEEYKKWKKVSAKKMMMKQ